MTELFFEYSDPHKFFPDFNINNMRHLLMKMADDFHFKSSRIQATVLNEEELFKINKQFLKHEYYTDIITFDYSDNKILAGDLYISGNRCEENATEIKTTALNELQRYIIHGVLHLCGMDDKTEEMRLAMREREDYYLGLI